MDVTSRDFWVFVSQMLQAIGQIGSVVVAFYAVRLVQNYTRKKDEADFIRNRWNEQSQMNLACIQNNDTLRAHEAIVYGRPMHNIELSRKYFIIFTMLNQIQHLYIATKHGVLEKNEFEASALQTLKLLKREQVTVAYLLAQRGYTEDFGAVIAAMFEKTTEPEFPKSHSD